MAFWIGIAVLTAAATIALLAPLYRSRSGASSREAEIAIYRDQLDEVGRDVARGVLPEGEAKAARNEIARRLLRAGTTEEREAAGSSDRRRLVVIVALIAIPLVAVGVYAVSPRDDGACGAGRDLPIEARLADPDPCDIAVVQARVVAFMENPSPPALPPLAALMEAAIELNPDAPVLWQSAAYVYLFQGRFSDVAFAYDRLIELAGPAADPTGDFGTTLGGTIYLAMDRVTEDVVRIFLRVLTVDPDNIAARYHLALGLTERGEVQVATAAWLALLADEPPGGADWGDLARAQLVTLGVEPPPRPDAPAAPGVMTEADLALINAMVDRLAARLVAEPNNPSGWGQLILSYLVLERWEDALRTVGEARTALAGDAAGLAAMETMVLTTPIARTTANPLDVEGWTQLIRSYNVLGRVEAVAEAVAAARAALAGKAEAAALIDAAAQPLEPR